MKLATFDELEQADDTEYITTEAFGTTLRLGSLNSDDIIEWFEIDGEGRKAEAGLQLLIRSLVDTEGHRVPKEKLPAMLEAFRKKNARTNSRLVKVVLKLNGFDTSKNSLGEAASDDLPTG